MNLLVISRSNSSLSVARRFAISPSLSVVTLHRRLSCSLHSWVDILTTLVLVYSEVNWAAVPFSGHLAAIRVKVCDI